MWENESKKHIIRNIILAILVIGLLVSGADMYKNYIHVVWIGTYGGFFAPDELVAQVQSLLDRQTEANILGFVMNGSLMGTNKKYGYAGYGYKRSYYGNYGSNYGGYYGKGYYGNYYGGGYYGGHYGNNDNGPRNREK